ncbi:MAG: topoisomerase DNA-binding C4 zinc finger domain-containing protein [Chthoniobacterales bacterium]
MLRPASRPASHAGTTSSDSPHCPKCNGVMVTRHARKGAQAGKQFWGCSAYPACRGTREM